MLNKKKYLFRHWDFSMLSSLDPAVFSYIKSAILKDMPATMVFIVAAMLYSPKSENLLGPFLMS